MSFPVWHSNFIRLANKYSSGRNIWHICSASDFFNLKATSVTGVIKEFRVSLLHDEEHLISIRLAPRASQRIGQRMKVCRLWGPPGFSLTCGAAGEVLLIWLQSNAWLASLMRSGVEGDRCNRPQQTVWLAGEEVPNRRSVAVGLVFTTKILSHFRILQSVIQQYSRTGRGKLEIVIIWSRVLESWMSELSDTLEIFR